VVYTESKCATSDLIDRGAASEMARGEDVEEGELEEAVEIELEVADLLLDETLDRDPSFVRDVGGVDFSVKRVDVKLLVLASTEVVSPGG
jgi:hypothetical protein